MASVAPSQETIPPSLIPVILDSPAMTTPDGETPNFIDPPNLSVYIYTTLALGLFFSTFTLAARVYTKAFIIRGLGWEDYTVMLSWVLFVAFCGEIFVDARLVGVHMWNETVGEVFTMLYTANNVEIIYVPCICLIKVSILLQYVRIFAPTRCSNPVMWWSAYFMMACNVVFYVVEMFFDIFTCSPRELSWNQLVNGWCFDVNKILLSVAIFNLVSDVLILLLPQYSIWRLHMARKRKLGVSAIFGLGLLACVVTGLRVQSTVQLIQTQDASWYLGGLALWAIAEISLAIISSSLPTMPKFFKAMSSHLSTYSLTSRSGTSKDLSKATASSASHEKTPQHVGAKRPRAAYWESEDIERGPEPDTVRISIDRPDSPGVARVERPPLAELDSQERIYRTFQIERGMIPPARLAPPHPNSFNDRG